LTDRHPIRLTWMNSREYRGQHNKGPHPLIKLVSTVKINRPISHRHYSNTRYPHRQLSHYTSCFLSHGIRGRYPLLGPQSMFKLILKWIHNQHPLLWLAPFFAYIPTCDRIHNSKIEYTLILI
jgi:hypothetical protein